MVTEEMIYRALGQVKDPELNHTITELGLVREVEVDPQFEGRVDVTLMLTTPHCPFVDTLVRRVEDAVSAVPGVRSVHVSVNC